MRVALGQAARPTDEFLTFARQLGFSGVQLNVPDLPGTQRWEVQDLIALRERVASFGLRLEAIEGIPNEFYEGAMLSDARRDKEIENVMATIRNIGHAGIDTLAFGWVPLSVWRTDLSPAGRGNAIVSRFDLGIAENSRRSQQVYVARRDHRNEDAKDSWTRGAHYDVAVTRTDADMWESYEYFVRAVVPVAEQVGVQLVLHPDDPPVPSLGGIARIFRNVPALERAGALAPGPGFGFALCLGTVSEMGGEKAVLDAIYKLGPQKKIAYVHLRDVRGTVPNFDECFLGEGNYDPAKVVRSLATVGFDGFILDDHTPGVVGDSAYGHRGRAFALGYIQGLIDMMCFDDRAGQAVA
jgi:mannonate dehydratase